MDTPPLRYRIDGAVARFTIDREAHRNALNPEVVDRLLTGLEAAATDPAVRVVLLTGAGDKAFCAGADLGGATAEASRASFARYADLLKRLAGFPKPTVARVKGYCLAGGMGLMLACDIVIAASTARFGTPEVNVGLFPMMIGALIYRNVLRKQALQMVLLGERFDAPKALEMGLLTRIAAPQDLDREVETLLAQLAAKSPIGMRLGKEAFHRMADMPFEAAVDFLAGQLAAVAATEDAAEGITAFFEKRTPRFTGR